jgi:hypothetical protein
MLYNTTEEEPTKQFVDDEIKRCSTRLALGWIK